MTTLYWAHYETPNFDFDSFGKTKKECLDSLLLGIAHHCIEYGVSDKSRIDLKRTARDEFFPIPLISGACFRDKNDELLIYTNTATGWKHKGKNL